MIRDHSDIILKGYAKHTRSGLVIELKILALLEGFLHAKALCPFNLIVEGDFATIISSTSNKERGSWMFDN